MQRRVVVVGAGPAGIASALALKDAGLEPVVLEQADSVASSWRSRYEGLRLNTWRRLSHLPGRPFPKGTPTFPTRDQLVQHVERHADESGIELRLGVRVERIEQDDGEWVVLADGGELRSRQVIVATGHDHIPVVPEWRGREAFAGMLLHSAEYRSPAPFEGSDVLVVGPGSSGMEIATELGEGGAGRVWLSVRTPPNILLRQGPGPLPGDVIATGLWHLPTRLADRIARFGRRMDVGDLTDYGLPVPETGVFADVRGREKVPAIVDKEVIEAIKSRRIEVVGAVEALDEKGVEFADGTRVEPHAVICATGYTTGLEPLVGHLGVLEEAGLPKAIGPTPPAEGLWFIGYLIRPAGLGYMGKEARRVAKAIARNERSRPRLTNSRPPAMNPETDRRHV